MPHSSLHDKMHRCELDTRQFGKGPQGTLQAQLLVDNLYLKTNKSWAP